MPAVYWLSIFHNGERIRESTGETDRADAKGDKAIAVPLSIGAVNVLTALKGQHSEFVFTYRGKPIKEIKTAFKAACIRASVGRVSDAGEYVGFTWHGLRHTWATWHRLAGTPTEALQRLGGWADPRMVETYAHFNPGHLARFANNPRKVDGSDPSAPSASQDPSSARKPDVQ